LRTDAAHTPVSTLGKMFRITFLPLKSESFTSAKSFLTAENSGAATPTFGSSPAVCAGCS
jgi:hypothetical protein